MEKISGLQESLRSVEIHEQIGKTVSIFFYPTYAVLLIVCFLIHWWLWVAGQGSL
jgi:hypothetical protein